jgi:hypothetical protein
MDASKQFPNYCQLTFETEGGHLRAVLRPHCPGNVSGVTIGPGYDMKARSVTEVDADLRAAGVPAEVATKLAGGAGKSGDTAREWIRANFPGNDAVITVEASSNLFLHVYPTYAELVRRKVSEKWGADWPRLPLPMKEVLVDLAFRGDMSRFKEGVTRHERLIEPPVVANDFQAFRRLITDYEYWQANTNLPNLRDGSPNTRITARGRWLENYQAEAAPAPSVSFPFDLGGGLAPTEDATAAYYQHTEVEHQGGYFPIGANTVWHGGVHLRVDRGTPVRAPCDGKLVAARLSDDPAHASGHFGSRSFVLLAHEVAGSVLNKTAPRGKLIGYVLRASVNMRGRPTTSGARLIVLEPGDELRRLDDEEPSADGFTWAHVEVSAAANAGKLGTVGYVAIRPEWYTAVREDHTVEALDEEQTYTFYSLYMHLGCEPLDGSSEALDQVTWLHAEPSTSSEALTAAVGEPPSPNAAADVQRVQARLKVHGVYSGPESGSYDAATKAAIEQFQGQMVRDGIIRGVDVIISPGGRTWTTLQRAPQRARPQLDEALVDALRSGDVVALDKPIGGGEVLWTSGEYGSPGHRAELIHWEIFSAEPLLPGRTKVEDDDDDFNLDNAQIVDMVEQDTGWWESDEILTLAEIVRFYAEHPSAKLLRDYQCRFISEWAVDLDVAIPKMHGAHLFSTHGLAQRMQPYLWWQEAEAQGVALPDPKCWHYNPITFTRALAAAGLPSSAAASEQPPAAAASTDDHVYVVHDGRRVPHFSQADPAWASRILGNRRTISAAGCAITSVAMVLKYYGRDVDPKILDEHLDNNSGYQGDAVVWDVAFRCGAVAGGVTFSSRRVVTSNFKTVLDERISQNKPTIARVDYGTDDDGLYNHVVVIVGRHKDGHYIMNDPASSAGDGVADPSDINLLEKTTRKSGYTLTQLDCFDPV